MLQSPLILFHCLLTICANLGTYLCGTRDSYEILEYMECSVKKEYIGWYWVVLKVFFEAGVEVEKID